MSTLHKRHEPEAPIHRAVNISSRELKDRIEPVEHEEHDLWKAEDPATGRTSERWWDKREDAIDHLAHDIDLDLCQVNECMEYLGEGAQGLFCDGQTPDEYIECAVEGCEYPTEHTETVHCTTHTWGFGRTRVSVSDGGRDS